MRGQVLRLVVSGLLGALAGLGVYQLTQISGPLPFLVTGAVAGSATATLLRFYRRSARLTEVRLTIPQFSVLTFVVNDDAKQVAWKLFVETVTRTSTQPLKDEEGLLREALSSLYGLFATTRDLLKAARPSVAGRQTVEHLAIAMLNRELRPFLSKWHPRLREFEKTHPSGPESVWPDNAACRAELRRVQQSIHEYALNFARLAGVAAPELLLMVPALEGVADQQASGHRAADRGSGDATETGTAGRA